MVKGQTRNENSNSSSLSDLTGGDSNITGTIGNLMQKVLAGAGKTQTQKSPTSSQHDQAVLSASAAGAKDGAILAIMQQQKSADENGNNATDDV